MSSIINPSELTPLTIHEFKLFVPARVNQANTFAYLDTGASLVTISPKLAEALPRAGTITVGSAFEQRVFDTVEDIEIDFLGNVHCINACVNQISDGDLPFNVDVTLDAPTIFSKALIFDFRLMGIMLPKQVSGESWIGLPAKFVEDKGLCIIQLVSQNGAVSVLFDTGAGFSAVNSAHIEEIRLDLQPAFELEISDSTGAKGLRNWLFVLAYALAIPFCHLLIVSPLICRRLKRRLGAVLTWCLAQTQCSRAVSDGSFHLWDTMGKALGSYL